MASIKTKTNTETNRKTQKVSSFGEDLEKSKPLYTVGGNVKWYSCCGKQYGGSSKNYK